MAYKSFFFRLLFSLSQCYWAFSRFSARCCDLNKSGFGSEQMDPYR